MEQNCLETVLMQRSALKSQMAANRAALQIATRRARYERVREAQVWQLSPQEEQVVTIIYMYSGYARAPAVEYLQQLGRRRGWPQKASEMLGSLVEDMFLAVEPVRLAELSDQGDPAAPVAMSVACAFLAEWDLFRWVDAANQRKGVAPSTEALLQELERLRLQLPEAVRFPSRGVSSESRARVWALQWRKRWGAHHGRVRVREDIPAAEMRAKACSSCGYSYCEAWGPRSGLFSGTLSWWFSGWLWAAGRGAEAIGYLFWCPQGGSFLAWLRALERGPHVLAVPVGGHFLVHRPSRLGSGSTASRARFL